MDDEKRLTPKEVLFCHYLAQLGNAREAAARAGIAPEQVDAAVPRMLAKPAVVRRLKVLEEEQNSTQLREKALRGLERLAFGSVADAVSLTVLAEPTPADIARLDLFSVAEIRQPKGGGFEMKFFDRFKALDALLTLSKESQQSGEAHSFYSALQNSAQQDLSAPELEDGHAV